MSVAGLSGVRSLEGTFLQSSTSCFDCWSEGLQGFETPSELAEVPAYLSRLQGRKSWKNTSYSEDQVIAGWASHT